MIRVTAFCDGEPAEIVGHHVLDKALLPRRSAGNLQRQTFSFTSQPKLCLLLTAKRKDPSFTKWRDELHRAKINPCGSSTHLKWLTNHSAASLAASSKVPGSSNR